MQEGIGVRAVKACQTLPKDRSWQLDSSSISLNLLGFSIHIWPISSQVYIVSPQNPLFVAAGEITNIVAWSVDHLNKGATSPSCRSF